MLIANDFEAQEYLQHDLLPGEKLLWTGRPATGIKLRTSDIFFIPFSILWFGFAIFWEAGVLSGGPSFFAIWGIPFICVGFYVTIGRFFYDKKMREKTVYGITPDRIIINSGVFTTTVESFNIRILSNISIDEKSDGSGTIKLGSNDHPWGELAIGGWRGNKKIPALEFIQNVRNVYNLILQQQKG